MAKQTSMATMVANLELRSTQYKREMDQATARNKKLTRELKSTSAAGDMFGRSMRGAAQGVAAIDGPLGGISGRVGALNGLLASGATSWALFGAGVAGVVATFYQSIRAGEEMERGQLKIEGLLRATGNASGRTAQQLDEQARSVARATLASISGIRDAQGVLLTFKSVQADVFDNAIVLSQDLAAVMGGDAKSAALQLGKALEDPATGLTALKRSGVSFTEVEKEQIRTMQESGRVAEAQRYILAKLAQQVGGAGSAEAGGLTGAVDSLAQSWQEFLEEFSRTSGSTGVATRAIQGLTGVLDNSHELAEGLGTAFTALTVLMAGRFAGAIGPRVAQLALLNAETYKATVQTNAFGQVVGRTTIATRTATMAAAGLKSAFAFLGGPVGVITVAVASLVAWNASQPTAEAHAETLTGKINELTSSWKKLTDAQRINREQKVLVERDGLQKEINKLIKQRDLLRDGGTKEGSRFGYQVALGNDDSRVRELNDQIDTLNQALKEADAGLANLGKPNKARLREETEAEFKAALEREASERAAAMARLQAEQESGAQQLSQLDEFLADRRGKIQLDHEQRLQQIATLQIAEEELTKRGFDSIEALQSEYSEREKERYQMALAEEQARSAGGEGDAERQRMIARLEVLQLSWLTEMEQLQVQQDEEMALLDKAYTQKIIARDEYERSLTQLEKKHQAQRQALEETTEKARLGTYVDGAKQLLSAVGTHNKKMAALQMGMAIYTAGTAMVENIAKASKVGFPQNIPFIIGATTQGLQIKNQLNSIKEPAGIAHGGLDYVPKESTYLLDRGERVLSPNQNADLTAALKGGGLQSSITVNLYEDAAKAGQVERSQGVNESEVISIFVANIRDGGDAATAVESTYNLSRSGF
ncbi:hypothetical protein ACJJI4_04235 [Microbulbifer sp. TRSA002]|uniref:hypothetical protein n=1 Tax=Microbulbifer sp. TRSA002 TaxID=3243382 RepID=UPI00403A3BDA